MAEPVKTVTLTVDGKSVTVPPGTTVLQACEQADSPVPFYCYHPGLSIAGNCRICLVEIEKAPKLQIACYTQAAEGMVVRTASDNVLQGRQDVLEFLLVNHPLDCPVCDQAGECWLQDYYMAYGLYNQKFDEQKVKKSAKAVSIGPTVMLDMERCILCSRCVRFCDEITKTGELGIFNRGDHSELGIHPGKPLDNPYAGNVVDVCPVGALTDKDFRFKCRVWYLGSTSSVCPGCSKGCNIEIHDNRERGQRPHIAQGRRIMRLKPRYNPDVNQWWMCDEGRYGYKFIDENRLTQVQLRDGSGYRAGSWDEALGLLTQTLRRLKDAQQLDRAGVVLSTHLTNEDLYVAKRVFGGFGIRSLAVQPARQGSQDDFLRRADKSPNTRGAQAMGLSFDVKAVLERAARKELSLLWVFGGDLVELAGEAQAKTIADSVDLLVFQGSNVNRTCQLAHMILPSAVYAEKDGTFTNEAGRVQRIRQAVQPLGEAKPEWRVLLDVADRTGFLWEFRDAQGVFGSLASHEAAFKGLSYDVLGDQGAMLPQKGSDPSGKGSDPNR
ncbi:MAG: molybdopterin-dependent oxidoreductase [Candidatus Omnitrophica bacterium]|nr:molybdopterin-dependent oxidoreductase [Candidatus Omnitrophota bacterium]